ncbi:hypothetical protein SDRG_00140 [Saprolegnia diclina VS20]|uniref:DUF1279 domain-containing protein n=1 Tax=Saprolegnia diclina (strain VS20) TaxID=1156394 RepID=T0QW09_SAPDV|nr:hypothetical protein SDRG_00140 [Saprolegnia diclina VS20]EQC42404.1 hypothetical protein SDRG_00140 [Saprolegnia diclina VS20]|eukprot:XP_008603827.1 hypothetical protein SDRG_00140 [Saprolegnia diclina VS20]
MFVTRLVPRVARAGAVHARPLHAWKTSAPMALARPMHFANPILRFCSSGSAIKPSAVAKPTSFGRFKDLWKQYGLVAVGTYLTIYGIVLGSMYAAIETGVLSTKKEVPRKEGDAASPDDESSLNILTATNRMMDWTNAIGLGQYLDIPEVNSKTSAFLIAWVATKFTEPLRFAVTLMVTPRVARIIRRYRA